MRAYLQVVTEGVTCHSHAEIVLDHMVMPPVTEMTIFKGKPIPYHTRMRTRTSASARRVCAHTHSHGASFIHTILRNMNKNKGLWVCLWPCLGVTILARTRGLVTSLTLVFQICTIRITLISII
jgi:hypothetical protein